MSFKGKVEGFERFNRSLAGLASDFDDSQAVLEEVAERAYYPIMQEIFETGGRGNWKPLTAATLRSKRARYGDKPIGQASGALMRSIVKRGAAMNIHMTVGRNTVLLGSRVRHAPHFDRERPVHDFTEKDFDRMAEVAEEAVKDKAEKRGFKAK